MCVVHCFQLNIYTPSHPPPLLLGGYPLVYQEQQPGVYREHNITTVGHLFIPEPGYLSDLDPDGSVDPDSEFNSYPVPDVPKRKTVKLGNLKGSLGGSRLLSFPKSFTMQIFQCWGSGMIIPDPSRI